MRKFRSSSPDRDYTKYPEQKHQRYYQSPDRTNSQNEGKNVQTFPRSSLRSPSPTETKSESNPLNLLTLLRFGHEAREIAKIVRYD